MAKELQIVEGIGGWQFDIQTFYDSLKKEGEEVQIPINSYGGSVFECLTMYNILKDSPSNTTAKILGFAMSAGTVFSAGADKVIMPQNGYYMIHEAWMYTAGEASDLQKDAELLEKMNKQMANIYAERSGLPIEDIRAMMKATTFLTGPEAMEMGFVDELYNEVEIHASFAPEAFANLPQALIKETAPAPAPKADEKKGKIHQVLAALGLTDTDAKLTLLEEERDTARNQLSTATAQLADYKAQITALSTEKTTLAATVDQQTELIATLEKRPAAKPHAGKTGDEGLDDIPYDSITAKAMAKFNK